MANDSSTSTVDESVSPGEDESHFDRNQEIKQADTEGDGRSIKLKEVTKTFAHGTVIAAEDVSTTIEPGEFVVILGPSGCGKTTTLRCISGLEQPDEGQILLGDEDITNAAPKDRDLAFVFQDVTLFTHMSVRENIRFGLDMATDLGGIEKEERVQEVSKMLGINDLLDRKPTDLSGGQQQRVSIGRAMVMEPAGFLLDEPFASLDANLRDEMQTEIKKLQRQIQRPMVFVTHDQSEAMNLADKILVLNHAHVQQIGTPHEIYNEPANRFVVEFIGSPSTNIIEGTVEQRGDGFNLITDLFSLPLEADIFSDFIGEMISIGIRPEYLDLSANIEDGSIIEDAEVTLVEPEGSRDTIYLEKNGAEIRASVEQGTVPIDSIVDVHFDIDDSWFFDEEGNRIR